VVSFGEKSNEVTSSALISIDFQGTTLYTVLNVLSMKTGMKLISDTTLYNKKIMLSLKDVTAEEALNALLDTYDLYYVKQGDANIYVIKSKDDKNHITVSRVIFCNYATLEQIQ
jgi:type II secretory pathway component HofQ